MRRPDLRGGLLLSAALFAVAACSEAPQPGPPTEQEIHSADSGVPGGKLGRHSYRCEDGKRLFVDFGDSGLQVELRDAPNASPLVLTAPTQGLQYVGEGASATLAGATMAIVEASGRTRVCRREGVS